MHRLAVVLLKFTSLSDVLHGLNYNLREDFFVPHMTMRLWGIAVKEEQAPELTQTGPDIPGLAESLLRPYCGPHVLEEIRGWFGEEADRLRSFAICPAKWQAMGLLVLGSETRERFYPGMGQFTWHNWGNW